MIKPMFKRQEEKGGERILAWMSIIAGNIVFFYWLSELITEGITFVTFSRPVLVVFLYLLGLYLLKESKES